MSIGKGNVSILSPPAYTDPVAAAIATTTTTSDSSQFSSIQLLVTTASQNSNPGVSTDSALHVSGAQIERAPASVHQQCIVHYVGKVNYCNILFIYNFSKIFRKINVFQNVKI